MRVVKDILKISGGSRIQAHKVSSQARLHDVAALKVVVRRMVQGSESVN